MALDLVIRGGTVVTAEKTFRADVGIAGEKVTAKGFGMALPVADNRTPAGRQQNRRVELVVSGDVIGTSLNAARPRSCRREEICRGEAYLAPTRAAMGQAARYLI